MHAVIVFADRGLRQDRRILISLFLGMLPTLSAPLRAAEVVEVTADRAPVAADGAATVTVEKGRWFGVTERKGDLLRIQLFDGQGLRDGWVDSRYVRMIADSDVDLTAEALKAAKELHPAMEAATCRERVDALARRLVVGGKTPRERAASVAAFLFERQGFAAGEPSTLDAVLDRKQGNCLGLSLLYLCVARQAGLPVFLVTAPRHVFVEFNDGQQRFYIETTRKGELHDSPDYLKDHLGAQQAGEAGGTHLQAVTMPEAVGVLHEELGRVWRDAEKYREALPHYARAAEINPRHAEAIAGLGAVLTALGKLDGGAKLCEAAAALNPRDPEARCSWGIALRRLGRHADACARYAEAVQLRPQYDRAYCNWGVALERMGKNEDACGKYARALDINPRNADAWFNWGAALANLAKHAAACEKFARADALKPRDFATFLYWGTALHKQGKDAEACAKFAEAAGIDPKSAEAHLNWGIALLRTGKRVDGVEKLNTAAALSPSLKPRVGGLLRKLTEQ